MNVSEPCPTLDHSNSMNTCIQMKKCDIQESTSHLYYILPLSPCEALNKFEGTNTFPFGILISKFSQ